MVRFPFPVILVASTCLAIVASAHSPPLHVRELQSTTVPTVASTTGTNLSTVVETIVEYPNLSVLADALVAVNFADTLCLECNYTFFAPTDDAFLAFNEELLGKLFTPEWSAHLTELLSLHVTQPTTDRVLLADLEEGMVLSMLNGDNMTVALNGSTIRLSNEHANGSFVVGADLVAYNGVLQPIDAVLSPEFVKTDLIALAGELGEFSILLELVELLNIGASIVDDDFTVFAPTDAAFQALEKTDKVSYMSLFNITNFEASKQTIFNHVVAGLVPSLYLVPGVIYPSEGNTGIALVLSESNGTLMVNDATIKSFNLLANNGIAHGIDKVFLSPIPPPAAPVTPSSERPTMAPASGNNAPGPTNGSSGERWYVSVWTTALLATFVTITLA